MEKKEGKVKLKLGLSKLLGFDLRIKKEDFPRLIPFVLFITTLILLYIANKYYSEKNIIQINKLTKEIKDLRSESITTKAELMNYTKQSEILKKANEMGLKEFKEPVQKIIIEKK